MFIDVISSIYTISAIFLIINGLSVYSSVRGQIALQAGLIARKLDHKLIEAKRLHGQVFVNARDNNF